ncbi:MAG: hypothetical protein J6M60_06795 [Clostridia bacterium]|nr:hypothetical protein [Clostridia bacterium]
MDNIKLLTTILAVVVGLMCMLLVILALIQFKNFMDKKNAKNPQAKKENNNGKITGKTKKFKDYRTESIMNFLEFDTIVDNMISQKDGMRYVMVIECQGINYDLMSQVEKNAVEESFVQFLNTIRYPIQIYTQTRTINLEDSIQTYKAKVDEAKLELDKEERKYEEMRRSGRYPDDVMNKQYIEVTKRKNLYEYGKDIIYNTERMSKNKNVLNKKYYVVVPYYLEEVNDEKMDKAEQRSYAFSELYTRCQSIMRTLSSCEINSRVLSSDELVELLYMAYNRDDAEVYGVDKAIKAGYDELYTTAQDVVEKQMKELDKEIEQKALKKAQQTVYEVRSDKQRILDERRRTKASLIEELAKTMIDENKTIIGEDVAEEAKRRISTKRKRVVKEGGTKEDAIEKKSIRKAKTTK